MAMSWVWVLLVAVAVLMGALTGRTDAVANAAFEGAAQAVTLCISLAGMLCLWTGIMEVMRQSGLASKLSTLLSPVLRRLFPEASKDRETLEAVSANVSANMLGLGNAATPLGIKAARLMSKGTGGEATNELCLLVVLNSASIQLIPATVAALRLGFGAHSPFDILPCVWLTSIVSVTTGILMSRLLSARDAKKRVPAQTARGRGGLA